MKFLKPSLMITLSLMLSCRGAKVENRKQESYHIVVLLARDINPDDITYLSDKGIVSQKRSSRSQNQWIVEILEYESQIEAVLKQVESDPLVKSAKLSISSEPNAQNSTNIQRPKSRSKN